MSNNEKNEYVNKNFNNTIKIKLHSNKIPENTKFDSASEPNSKFKCLKELNKFTTNFSTSLQSQRLRKDSTNDENEHDNCLDQGLEDAYKSCSVYLNSDLIQNSNKPKLSLKDSRTKLKELRDKLYPLSIDEKIRAQENILPVPLEKMNDEKYKILRMHNLKKPSLPEYKSCEKYEDYYKPFENSFEKKNEFYLLKKKKSIYSNTKVMKLQIQLKNKNMEKAFPLYKDQDIGVYEYWQVPLIESKIDEDNDSDEEQINLAKKVCELDLMEGIKYIQKNGIESLYNEKFKKTEENKKPISI
jgi:hypothetical protein